MKKNRISESINFKGIIFIVERRRVRYSRIEFKPQGLRLIVPRQVKPESVLQKNHRQIIKKYHKLREDMALASHLKLEKGGGDDFSGLIVRLLQKYSARLDVRVKEIKLRSMKRRWGSCRSSGVITLNRSLQYLPEHLLAYVMVHELLHLRISGHGKKFKKQIATYFPDYRELDKQLYLYGLKLLSKG